MGTGGDIDHPGSPRLGICCCLGQGRHHQVSQQEVAQVVGGHLGLVTILSHLPENEDMVRMTQSRALSPVSKHDPSVVGEHVERCVQVQNGIGETADTLKPEEGNRDFISWNYDKAINVMIPHEVQMEADQGPGEALLVLAPEFIKLGLHRLRGPGHSH